MGLREDLASDFLLVDGLEPATIQRLSEQGNVIRTWHTEHALRRAVTDEEMQELSLGLRHLGLELLLDKEWTIWHFPVDDMGVVPLIPATVPVKGFQIIANGLIWTIFQRENQTFNSRYRMTCVLE